MQLKVIRPIPKTDWIFRLAMAYLALFLAVVLLADILPLAFEPTQIDLAHLYQPPFAWELYATQQPFHWLGTDQLGHDILANVLYGCRTAMLVSLPAMLLAVTIGLLLGGMAGYFGDRSLQVSRAAWFAFLLPAWLAYFYGFYLRQMALQEAFQQSFLRGMGALFISLLLFLSISLLGFPLKQLLQRWAWFRHPTFVPVDQAVLKLIELLSSVPALVLILLLASLTKASLLLLVFITGLTCWTEPARLVRAEMLRIRNQAYIETATALGASAWHIWFRHALPNALPPVIVAFVFGVANLMALESTLSFLGIGIPPDVPSWGRLINGMRINTEAWWLLILPGLILCATILSLQTCAGYWLKKRR
ncbi:MAG: ABC transporter permease [Bacteroidota bacterium]